MKIYATQTKILEGQTKRCVCVFEVLLTGVNTLWQLIPIFDKPAFSRFSQNCEPRFVVEIIGKIVKRQICQKWG